MPDHSAKSNYFISRGQIFPRVQGLPTRNYADEFGRVELHPPGNSFVSSFEQRAAH